MVTSNASRSRMARTHRQTDIASTRPVGFASGEMVTKKASTREAIVLTYHPDLLDTPAGEFFNQNGHKIQDMNFLPIERVLTAGDSGHRTGESVWIRHYDSVNFGNNAHV